MGEKARCLRMPARGLQSVRPPENPCMQLVTIQGGQEVRGAESEVDRLVVIRFR